MKPRIPGLLKDVRHVAFCYSSHFNGIPQLVPHVASMTVNDTLQK
jgi:hypothetical protein